MVSKVVSADDAVLHVADNAVVAVNSSSGLCCPDAVLAALGRRFDDTGSPRNLTSIHPIAAGDFFGIKGVDHIAKPGCLSRIIAGSLPSGPTKAEPPRIWQMITGNALPVPELGPGDYCFMMQQTSPVIVQEYIVEFVIQTTVSTTQDSFGAIKALYR